MENVHADREPAHPLTAREAASKRIGDLVILRRSPGRVTLVDESPVYEIEGKRPKVWKSVM
ncbi:MAG: hypothetical protein FJ403_09520 [Verrucomicrobia bacterium]|nr:hypothetical protein [Verrucomicrobiota bacterium]